MLILKTNVCAHGFLNRLIETVIFYLSRVFYIYIHKVVISVCLFVCLIITQEQRLLLVSICFYYNNILHEDSVSYRGNEGGGGGGSVMSQDIPAACFLQKNILRTIGISYKILIRIYSQ